MVKDTVIIQKPNDLLKNLVTNIPLITIYIIILGIVKQLIFYRNFHLPIKYFLGVSELALIISDDLMFSLLIILIINIIIHLIRSKYFKENKYKIEVDNIEPLEITRPIFILNICRILGIIVIIISLYFIIFDKYYYNTLFFTEFLIIGLVLSMLHSLIKWIISLKPSIVSINIYMGCFSLILMLINNTSVELESVVKGRYKNTIIITNDSIYTSTASNYFIGKTEKYVFIYNVKDTSTTIIPTESIKKITLKMR